MKNITHKKTKTNKLETLNCTKQKIPKFYYYESGVIIIYYEHREADLGPTQATSLSDQTFTGRSMGGLVVMTTSVYFVYISPQLLQLMSGRYYSFCNKLLPLVM